MLRRLAAVCCAAIAAAAATSARAQPGEVTVLNSAAFVAPSPAPATAQQVTLPHLLRLTAAATGSGSYRLTFVAPAAEGGLAVHIDGTNLPFEALVNGRHVHQSGGPRTRPVPLSSWRAAPSFRIPADALRPGENELELRILRGAAVYALGPVSIGSPEAIASLELRGWLLHNVLPLMIAAVLSAVGLIALALWRGRPDYSLFFWLGSGAMLWALQNFVHQLPFPLLPQPHQRVLLISFYAWFPLLLAVFFLRFSYHRWPWFERAAIGTMLLAAPVLYAANAAGQFGAASIALRGLVLLFIGTALAAIFRYAARARDTKGLLLLTAGALCVGSAAYDYALSLVSLNLRPAYLTTYAGAILVLLTAWMLLDRYQRAYGAYRDLNVDLERRVREASAELELRLAQTQAAREQAELASVAKSRFFAAASHDLRQPLHSLGLFSSALDAHLTSPQARATSRQIRESIAALESLFDALLDLSRLDAGVVTVEPRNVALQTLFDRLARHFHAEAVERELRLRFVPTQAVVRTDPLLLERIVTNLVSNALRYTHRGGVAVGVRRRGDRVAIEVCDTGVGIAPEKQAMVFEEFYQVSNPGRDRRRGLGLGLAIVLRLARLLDHPLSLRSTPGRGSRFCIELPRSAGPADAPVEEAPMIDDDALHGIRVLVVDDDLMVREGTAALLRQWQARPRTAASSDEAAAALDDGFVPEALIVDLRLGETVDGIDVVESLRARIGRATPALLVSGDTGAVELLRVRSSGIPLLTKPVAPAKLRSVLRALLSQVDRTRPAAALG